MTLDEARALTTAQGTRVVHLKVESYTRRIDRATIWGNPHPLRDSDRAGCLLAYVATMRADAPALARCGDLRGQVLGCWCAPRACHGDVLATLAAVDTVEERLALLDAWERELEEEVR